MTRFFFRFFQIFCCQNLPEFCVARRSDQSGGGWETSALADMWKLGEQHVLPKEELHLLTNPTTFKAPQTKSLASLANELLPLDEHLPIRTLPGALFQSEGSSVSMVS